jgi:hypothetical protein
MAKYLKRPKLEILRNGGRGVACLYIHLQDPSVKAVRSVRPQPKAGVHFYLDAGNDPVAIVLTEPAGGPALWRTAMRAAPSPRGKAPGARGGKRHGFLTDPDAIGTILRGLKAASTRLPNLRIGCVPHRPGANGKVPAQGRARRIHAGGGSARAAAR